MPGGLLGQLFGQNNYYQQPPLQQKYNGGTMLNGTYLPYGFDQMIRPPYSFPPDRNTFSPNDMMSYGTSLPWMKGAGI